MLGEIAGLRCWTKQQREPWWAAAAGSVGGCGQLSEGREKAASGQPAAWRARVQATNCRVHRRSARWAGLAKAQAPRLSPTLPRYSESNPACPVTPALLAPRPAESLRCHHRRRRHHPPTMLDVNSFLKERGGDPEAIRESQRRRYAPVEAVDEVIALFEEARKGPSVCACGATAVAAVVPANVRLLSTVCG